MTINRINQYGKQIEEIVKQRLNMESVSNSQDIIDKIDGILDGDSVQIKHTNGNVIHLQILKHYNIGQQISEQMLCSHHNCGDALRCIAKYYLFCFPRNRHILVVPTFIIKTLIKNVVYKLNKVGGTLPYFNDRHQRDYFTLIQYQAYLTCKLDHRNNEYNLLFNLNYDFLLRYSQRVIPCEF